MHPGLAGASLRPCKGSHSDEFHVGPHLMVVGPHQDEFQELIATGRRPDVVRLPNGTELFLVMPSRQWDER